MSYLLSNEGVHKLDDWVGFLGKGSDLSSVCQNLDRHKASCGHHCPIPEGCITHLLSTVNSKHSRKYTNDDIHNLAFQFWKKNSGKIEKINNL